MWTTNTLQTVQSLKSLATTDKQSLSSTQGFLVSRLGDSLAFLEMDSVEEADYVWEFCWIPTTGSH